MKKIKYYNGDKLVLEEIYQGRFRYSLRSAVYYEPDGKTVKEKSSYSYHSLACGFGPVHYRLTIEKYKDGIFDIKLELQVGNNINLTNFKDSFSEGAIYNSQNKEYCMKYDENGNKLLGIVYDLDYERVICEYKYEKDVSYCTVRYNPKNGMKVSERFFDKDNKLLSGKDYDSETGEKTTDIKYHAIEQFTLQEGWHKTLTEQKYNNKQELISETIYIDGTAVKELFYGDNQQVMRVIEYKELYEYDPHYPRKYYARKRTFRGVLTTKSFYNDKKQLTHEITYCTNPKYLKSEVNDDGNLRKYCNVPGEIKLKLYKKGKLKKAIRLKRYEAYNKHIDNKQISEEIKLKYLNDIAECCKGPNFYVTSISTYLDGKHIAHIKTYAYSGDYFNGGKKEKNHISSVMH